MRKIAAKYIFPISNKPIKNGILITDDNGKVIDLISAEKPENVDDIEFYNGIICPGFVNAHCHIELSHLCGLMPRGKHIIGFIEEIGNIRNSVSPQEKKNIAQHQNDLMNAEGIVAVGDISNCDVSFEMKSQSRIFYHTFVELFGLETELCDEKINEILEIVKTAQRLGLSASPTPHAPYTLCDKIYDAIVAQAVKFGIMSIHNQETAPENDFSINGTGDFVNYYKHESGTPPTPIGKTSIHRLLNKITPETYISLIHNVFTSANDYDCATAACKNITWVLCPSSNLYIENQLPPVEMLRSKGARIAIGTDSLSSNTKLSIMQEMLVLAQNFKDIELNEMLTWATLNGAKSIKADNRFGTFEKGKTPGVVLIENVNFDDMKLLPNAKSRLLI